MVPKVHVLGVLLRLLPVSMKEITGCVAVGSKSAGVYTPTRNVSDPFFDSPPLSSSLVPQMITPWRQEVWKDQLYRSFVGDRLFHKHYVPTTDVENLTLRDLIEHTLNVTDLPLSVFTTPEITVRSAGEPEQFVVPFIWRSFLVTCMAMG